VKKCGTCKRTLELSAFSKNVTTKDGLRYACRECTSIKKKENWRKNPRYRELHRKAARRKRLKKLGMDESFFYKLYEEQGGKCKICSTPMEKEPKNKVDCACVDHDHKTGKIRGLLCPKCNMAIGLFKDNIELLKIAINYLETNHALAQDFSR